MMCCCRQEKQPVQLENQDARDDRSHEDTEVLHEPREAHASRWTRFVDDNDMADGTQKQNVSLSFLDAHQFVCVYVMCVIYLQSQSSLTWTWKQMQST